MRSAHFEVRASRVIDRRNLSLTWSLKGIVMHEVDASHPPLSPTPPRYPWERGQLHSAGCCLHDASQSTCAFSYSDFFKALADGDFDLLQLTEEKRPELVAVVNQEENDATQTTGESIFHVYFAHLITSYVDWGKHFWIKLYVVGFEKLFPHTCDLQRGYTVNTHTNFKAILGVVIPAPPFNLANVPILQYNSMQIHGCMYTHACACFHNYTYVHTHTQECIHS